MTEPGSAATDANCFTLLNGECVSTEDCMHSAANVTCATCDTPLPPGTRAKVNADGVIVCVECAEALPDA